MEDAEPWRVSRMLPIIEGESLDGYISRVAAAHHFPRLAEITSLGGAEANNRQQASFLDSAGVDAIADCLRIEPSRLRHHAPLLSSDGKRRNMFGIELAADHFQFSYRRFSPTALAASPHHRALWSLRLFPFCVKAWEYLEERCPHPDCRRQQRWRRTVSIDLCDFCGEPLTRAVAEKVPQALRQGLKHLVDLVHPDQDRRRKVRSRLPTALRGLETDDLLELARILAAVRDPRRKHPIFSPTFCLEEARAVLVPALARTWLLLEGWPGAFEKLLADRLNGSANGRNAGNFKSAYHFLRRCKRRELSPALREVIENFLRRCQAAPSRAIDGHQAVKIAGRGLDVLLRLRRSGVIKSVLCLDGNQFYLLFDRDSVAEFAKKLKPQVRREYLTARLGIPTYTVGDLVDRGLLTASPVPTGRTERLAVFKDSADQLISSLAEKMTEPTTDYPVKLSKLMYCLGGGPKPWAAVLAAILNGQLDATLAPGKQPMVQRIHLRSAKMIALPVFADRPKLDPSKTSVPKADLADMMSLRLCTFPRYSEYLLGSGDHYVEICPKQALDMAKRVISTTEVAARLQIHHTEAYRLATHLGVSLEVNGLFNRESALRLIPELNHIFCAPDGPRVRPATIMKDKSRSIAGIRGKMCGKPPKLSDGQVRQLIKMYKTGEYLMKDLGKLFGISQQSVSRLTRQDTS
jgi:hypothetical protein